MTAVMSRAMITAAHPPSVRGGWAGVPVLPLVAVMVAAMRSPAATVATVATVAMPVSAVENRAASVPAWVT